MKDLKIENAKAAAVFASVNPEIQEAVKQIEKYGKFTTVVVEYMSEKTVRAAYKKLGKRVFNYSRAHMSVNTTTTTRRYNDAIRRGEKGSDGRPIQRKDCQAMGKPNVTWYDRILEYNENTNKLKLKLFLESTDCSFYLDENGNEITKEQAEMFMTKPQSYSNEPIHDVTYDLNNIQGIQTCGKVYGTMRLKNRK